MGSASESGLKFTSVLDFGDKFDEEALDDENPDVNLRSRFALCDTMMSGCLYPRNVRLKRLLLSDCQEHWTLDVQLVLLWIIQ